MDNKKWGKRFSTIFWWSLAILPLIVVLIQFIGYHLTFNSGISNASDLANYHMDYEAGDFTYLLYYYFEDSYYSISNWIIRPIRDMYFSLFRVLNITDSTIAYLLSWMTSVFFYHVIFDVSVWIFKMLHSWLDRWCCE